MQRFFEEMQKVLAGREGKHQVWLVHLEPQQAAPSHLIHEMKEQKETKYKAPKKPKK